jgi:hypothetical protein
VVEHVNEAELRVVVAEVLAVAADAVLVAKHLLKLGAHLVTVLARLHVQQPHAEKQPGGWEQAGEKRRKGVEICKKLRVVVWHGKQEMPVARARVSRTGNLSGYTTLTSRA